MPSLREIEKSVATLWLDKEARRWLVKQKGERPASLKDAPDEVLQTVDRKGVELYAELMNFGHHDVMDSIYPFCRKLLGAKWDAVVDDYLKHYPPDHYNFNRLCNRLSEYFTKYGGTFSERYPFLPELADYEWIELEKMEQDVPIERYPHQQLCDPSQLSALGPVVNQTLTLRVWHYDIMAIAARLEDGKKPGKVHEQTSRVAIYRHPDTHLCRFVELSEVAAGMVEEARQGATYTQLLQSCLQSLESSDPQAAVLEFLELVEELQEMGLFVGSK